MPISGKRLRLTTVDPLLRPEHPYLERDDACFYIREYLAGAGYDGSHSNNLIYNLKKDPAQYRNRPSVWKHKINAIDQVANELNYCLAPFADDFAGWCFMPMPPSKARDHPGYDDRLMQVLRRYARLSGRDLDVRELLEQTDSFEPSALLPAGQRPGPDQIQERLRDVADRRLPDPAGILIFDDILTTGAHFKGAQRLLREVYPAAATIGLFVARRVPREPTP